MCLIVPACSLPWLLLKKAPRSYFSVSSLSLFCLYFATQAQVFITNDTQILLVPGLCRRVGDLSLHSIQSLLGCF